MAKYVIEIPDNTHWIQWIMEGTKDHHPYMDWKLVEDLTPYTEPDEQEIRQKVEQEVWEFARMLSDMFCNNILEWTECFSPKIFSEILNLDYSEAKARYDAWQKQKDEIRVGEEIECDGCNGQEKLIVFKINNGRYMGIGTAGDYSIFDSIFDAWNWVDASNITLRKTGRYFPEVAELLKKMREE